MSIDPENVQALVVGIENYEWCKDLKGPASDALKFVTWLLGKGVQPPSIKLCLSLVDDDRGRGIQKAAEDKGVQVKSATREHIETVINHDFHDQGGPNKLLHVFWAGHGFITKTHRTVRRLWYSDSNEKNKWNLNLESLLQALQTSENASALFPTQIFFIDACADIYFTNKLYKTLDAESRGSTFHATGVPTNSRGVAKQYT